VGEVSYKGPRFPAGIIAHWVWLYHRFPLSFGEVEELMLVRGVIVCDETIRQGVPSRAGIRLPAAPPPETARRQVASRRGVLDDQRPSAASVAGRRPGRQRPRHLLQARRQRPPSGASANSSRGSARLLGCWSPTRSAVTQWPHRQVMPSVEHRQSRYLNNPAENSHRPTRQRERAMKRFRTPGAAPRLLAVFSVISPHAPPPSPHR